MDQLKARIAARVGTQVWMSKGLWQDLLGLLDDSPGAFDEVVFFDGFTHTPLQLVELRRRAQAMADLFPAVRSRGLRVGIDHIATFGHIPEKTAHSLEEPWRLFTDVNGQTAAGIYCPSDPRLQAYIADSYILLARTQPDYIWIDDDVRMEGHKAPAPTCFCDGCVDRFARETDRTWTRASLIEAFQRVGGEGVALRRRWLTHNRALLAETYAGIRAAVDTVNPRLHLTIQTTHMYYSGQGFKEWARTIVRQDGAPGGWRPGGGFWVDTTPEGMIHKGHAIGRQVCFLPATITDIQTEVENFPYQALNKATSTTATECAVYMAAGALGAAFNLGGLTSDPLGEIAPYYRRIASQRSFYDRLARAFGRSPVEGVWVADSDDILAACNAGGDWFDDRTPWSLPGSIAEPWMTGLPRAYDPAAASAVLFPGAYGPLYTREELLRLLAGGVMLDAEAVRYLHAVGLGEHTGFELAGTREATTIERLAPHALNGRFAGWRRDCRQAFWNGTAYLLKPLTAESQTLSEAVDFDEVSYGVLSGAFENRLGGRVVVSGYKPWDSISTLAKSSQMKALVRWLARETLPAYVASYHRVALWCRRDGADRRSLFLVNTRLDPAEAVELKVRDAPAVFELCRRDGATARVPASGQDGPYAVFTLPPIAPWEPVLLVQTDGRN